MGHRPASWLAGRRVLPTSLRAVLGFYGSAGVFDVGSLRLKRRVDRVTDAMLADAFAAVESALEREFDRQPIEFTYDTKLLMPAKLTLGYLYRRVDSDSRRERAEAVTRLAIEALLDGDMRDALNDAEYEDFEVDVPGDHVDRERVGEIAQSTLETRVREGFEDFPDSVRAAYDWAVDISEGHQALDSRYRELLAAAENGDSAARDAIKAEYRDWEFDETPSPFEETDTTLPYARSQYERVGVIYDGMLQMYESAGFTIDDAFERSIVLAIIGAQIWLDDVDDYPADRRGGQLTPVTAEYLLADDAADARKRVIEIAEAYLNRSTAAATEAESPLTGIATEYIYRSGDPETLPAG